MFLTQIIKIILYIDFFSFDCGKGQPFPNQKVENFVRLTYEKIKTGTCIPVIIWYNKTIKRKEENKNGTI